MTVGAVEALLSIFPASFIENMGSKAAISHLLLSLRVVFFIALHGWGLLVYSDYGYVSSSG